MGLQVLEYVYCMCICIVVCMYSGVYVCVDMCVYVCVSRYEWVFDAICDVYSSLPQLAPGRHLEVSRYVL